MTGLEEPKVHEECYRVGVATIQELENKERDHRIKGAVLVFLPGLLEIETMIKILNELNVMRTK